MILDFVKCVFCICLDDYMVLLLLLFKCLRLSDLTKKSKTQLALSAKQRKDAQDA